MNILTNAQINIGHDPSIIDRDPSIIEALSIFELESADKGLAIYRVANTNPIHLSLESAKLSVSNLWSDCTTENTLEYIQSGSLHNVSYTTLSIWQSSGSPLTFNKISNSSSYRSDLD
ncbi:MAG: hypothetical protein HRT58_04240 [Crocinitomicaceae bacterium]|nr:hypothetical protein [Flavobacteriales bacterium]NQZ34845.1 hypothetical protein [Crocinitomicaceae bacterium]PHR21533.1 MAG: hypothetical protein COA38_18650 [Fluviicola sp.]